MASIRLDALCGDPVYDLRDGEVCCHGTYGRHLTSILTHGLMAGGERGRSYRRQVHFSVRNPGEAVLSGMRESCQIAVYMDLLRASRDGVLSYRSSNDVLLSKGWDGVVPPQYIERAWHIRKRVQLYPEPR